MGRRADRSAARPSAVRVRGPEPDAGPTEALRTVPAQADGPLADALPTEALRRVSRRRADGPRTEVFRTTAPPEALRTEAFRAVPRTEVLRKVPDAPRTQALRRVPGEPPTEALRRVPGPRPAAPRTETPRTEAAPTRRATEALPRVPRPAEERPRVVWWHGDHLRTEALRIVPRHADGLHPATRPGPRHAALPPGIAAPSRHPAGHDRTGRQARHPRPRRPAPALASRRPHGAPVRAALRRHPAPAGGGAGERAAADVRRAGRTGQPARPPPAGARIGAGDRVALHVRRRGVGVHGHAGGAQDRGRVRAAGPRLPGGPRRLHRERRRRVRRPDAGTPARAARRDAGRRRVRRRPRRAPRRAPVDAAHPGRTWPGHGRPVGLHHLHVRLDRAPQGRRDRARRASSASCGSPPRCTASGSATGCTRA